MDIRNFFDQFQEIFYTLEKNRLRTILTGLTVSWGIFMLILLLGAGHGLENGIDSAFQEDAINSLWVRPGQTSVHHKGLKPGREISFHNPDVHEIGHKIHETQFISGRFYLSRNTTVRYQKKIGKFQVVGVRPEYDKIENFRMVKGRSLNTLDESQNRKVVILGIDVQKEVFQNQYSIGKHILIRGIPFQVIGIFDDPGDQWNLDRIFMPISTLQKVFNRNDLVQNIAMTINATDQSGARAVEKKVRDLLAGRHGFSQEDSQAIFIHNSLSEYLNFMDLFASIRIFVWIMGIGSIVAGMVSISNIMLITVKERSREIGIRKTLGATPNSVVQMILTESIIITFGFGYVGLVAGIAILEIMGTYIKGAAYFKNPEINMGIAFGALLILVISGSLAGIFPAIQAAGIRPVDALRDE
ncbi:MAG: ABC transporter permease [Proteobacteria bacterium]|nr:ABC transporter permease [Desulfobacula sp.]MBU3951623.1 ABC transporter permease [Pseudomonadota bacterium]MBU4129273.1 ABC transporter permease [Pseudomonadota bacterium]